MISVDDACASHHESLDEMMIYEKLDQKAVVVGIYAHDNNASISKHIQCSCKGKKKTEEAFSSTKTSTSEDVSPTPRINPPINQDGPSG